LPHPQTPNLPLASDPNLDITGFLYRSLEFLRKELSYSGTYKPSSAADTPDVISDADRRRSQPRPPNTRRAPHQLTRHRPQTQAPAWANQAPQAYSQAPAPQASAQAPSAGNPWQEAFQALSRKPEYATSLPNPGTVLSTGDANASGQYPGAVGFSSASTMGPIGSPDLQSASFNPGLFGPTGGAAAAMQQAAQSQVGSASARDSYLSQISDQSLEVLEHFGAEAPGLLNQYACAVEDALIEQVQRGNSLNTMLGAAGEERAAMNLMLTDPDILADYVNDFYGPNGPYPTETQEEAAARVN
jgi:hypothetical protein